MTILLSYVILSKRCKCAGVAQLVEQLICNQQVRGSSPFTSSIMEEFPSGQREQTVNLSAMPSVVRIHPLPPKNRLAFASLFFYPLRKQWHIIKGDLSPLYLISPSGLYIITPLGVYQKCFRNDDIHGVAVMICNSLLNWLYTMLRIDFNKNKRSFRTNIQ